MILKRNEIPTSDVFAVDYLKIQNISDDTHYNLATSLNNALMMDSNASVMEDIILEDFLNVYTQAKDIDFAGKNKNRIVESFLTTQYSDGSFNVDKRLNIDTQNGNIILPVISTEDINVGSIIVESDSNGNPGNSFNGGENGDINVIVNSGSKTIFEYEKVVSSSDTDDLVLTLTFELEDEAILNGMYIKLYAIENGKYPTIDMVDISKDSVTWDSIKNFGITGNLNKADYFLRFLPRSSRYVRIRFIQNSFDAIKTIFGYRYRSVIGVREVSFKKIEYDVSGTYVSIPFATGRAINSVRFDYSDVSNKDIKYLVSGNNGGKWIEVQESGSTISVSSDNTGILDGKEVKSLRVKMQMDKSNSVLNKVKTTEYLSISPNNRYYLKQTPEDLKISCGRHISFGREIRYDCERQNIPTKNFLLRYVPYKYALMKDKEFSSYMRVYVDDILQDESVYVVKRSSNPNNCEIEFLEDVQGNTQVAVDFKEISFKPDENNLESIIQLPANMFYNKESDIIVKKQDYLSSTITVLTPDQYQIVDIDKVRIQNSAFKSNATYTVAFIPSFEITNSYNVDVNEVQVSAMYLYYDTTVRFDYTYKSAYDVNLIKYYTPIGLEYRMEIE